ncbi:unnamed protein product, partial [Discosporangium mesarthrocarpum]
PPHRETLFIPSSPGPTRVTVVGNRGAPGVVSIVTMHGVGHNHRTGFGRLSRLLAEGGDLGEGQGKGGVVLYHVDTPGHEEDGVSIGSVALSLEAQATQLFHITCHLGLSWFVGLGSGAGANVLARYASDHPENVAGLVLANCSAEAAGRKERNMWLPVRFRLSFVGGIESAVDALVQMSFPPHSLQARSYRSGLSCMHGGNLLKYIDANLCRDEM